ncbi:hypothetical protein FV767_15565 [Vibrio parahaemolyticus]|nr:hypothetical protein [Vibrio parahaemolyticus]EGQ9822391.1 hypothetical protein [Vibrio parahaemolyticus]EGR1696866.1 hypothetical protein [Vibrio parahaemolyticus]OQU30365.1 hypothetical protein EN05_012305 [Vibrio parahaemolyticus]TNY60357.1 hypothetical protein CGK67_10140 [Vibrio parahaemolyticus]
MITEWKALSIANIKAHRGNGALLGLNDFDFEII